MRMAYHHGIYKSIRETYESYKNMKKRKVQRKDSSVTVSMVAVVGDVEFGNHVFLRVHALEGPRSGL